MNIMNVMIEFDVIRYNKKEDIIKDLDLIISAGKKIFLWSKTIEPIDMKSWCIANKFFDYIWDYIVKDSTNYSMVDFIVDYDEKIIKKFEIRGIKGNLVTIKKI